MIVAVPSWKRPLVETLRYLPHARIYVAKSQEKMYREANPRADIVGVDDKHQGNVCRIRNHIMDLAGDEPVCIVDDDLQYIGYHERGEMYKFETEGEVMDFLALGTRLARDVGAPLWGINLNPDKQSYREFAPFSTTSYIGSPFMVHLGTDIRFDESLSLKEDYDFTLQTLNKYRVALRLNKYFYMVKQKKQAGGCADYRTIDEERSQLEKLQRKWGSTIVRFDVKRGGMAKGSKKSLLLDTNPIISPPIRGV